MAQFLRNFDVPHILEIGVGLGTTTLPILAHMVYQRRPFKYVGIDIKRYPTLYEQINQMPGLILAEKSLSSNWNVMFPTINSTKFLLGAQLKDWKFDLILHDGEHNYATLSQELPLIQHLMHPGTVLFIDDYNDRYA